MQALTITITNATIRILIAVFVTIGAMLSTINLANAAEQKTGAFVAIVGQQGDASFDNAWFDLANDCTILGVVDNVNDTISPNVYTRLSCQMTMAQIENAPEYLGDSLLVITPLHTIYMPVVIR